MKKNIVIILSILISSYASGSHYKDIVPKDKGKKSNATSNSVAAPNLLKVATIDALDTVVFDLFNSSVAGTKVSFPIRFFSDDTVLYSLDFSFKYNQVKLLFDTIINLKPSIYSNISFYNPSDSTVRFTSSALGITTYYPDSVPLAIARFTVLSGALTISDLKSVKVFLNGDPCSVKITNYSTVGVTEVSPIQNSVLIYPNPTEQVLKIESDENAMAELLDFNGKSIIHSTKILANTIHEMDVTHLAKGIYMMKVFNNHFVKTTKVVIK
jgi:Secretion system C-terminal sorting domain